MVSAACSYLLEQELPIEDVVAKEEPTREIDDQQGVAATVVEEVKEMTDFDLDKLTRARDGKEAHVLDKFIEDNRFKRQKRSRRDSISHSDLNEYNQDTSQIIDKQDKESFLFYEAHHDDEEATNDDDVEAIGDDLQLEMD